LASNIQAPNLAIAIGAPDGFIVHSFAGDDPIACRDYVREKCGLPSFKPNGHVSPTKTIYEYRDVNGALRYCKTRRDYTDGRKDFYFDKPSRDNKNFEYAMCIWGESRDPRGTLVEAYLQSRRLELPDEPAFEAIRFHPACLFGSERFPAMVCLVRNIIANESQAVHRTALMPDGTAAKRNDKTFRMSLGPIAGGAIKLDPDEDVTQGLCIGEGVETCLAGRQMGYRPVWSVLKVSGVENFPVLSGIDGLTIFGEDDERIQSEKAIKLCANRWLEAGIETLTAWPLSGNDLNDEIRETP
jgi:putative DNA primase/helicase